MPKAMLITNTNLAKVSEVSKWDLHDDESLSGMYYVEDVQFPHGYVDQAIVTRETFDSTFKSDVLVTGALLISVDYK